MKPIYINIRGQYHPCCLSCLIGGSQRTNEPKL